MSIREARTRIAPATCAHEASAGARPRRGYGGPLDVTTTRTSYDYDRGDATIGEAAGGRNPARRNLESPSTKVFGSQPYPGVMSAYDETPPLASDGKPSEHFNSTILSHAYHLVVQSIGFDKAGRTLNNVPQRLSPKPTFAEVRRAFHDAAAAIYGVPTAVKVNAAFSAVGLNPPPHEEPDCGPEAC